MPKYRVREGKAVNAGEGRFYTEGHEFELTVAEAAPLVANETIEPILIKATKGVVLDDTVKVEDKKK